MYEQRAGARLIGGRPVYQSSFVTYLAPEETVRLVSTRGMPLTDYRYHYNGASGAGNTELRYVTSRGGSEERGRK